MVDEKSDLEKRGPIKDKKNHIIHLVFKEVDKYPLFKNISLGYEEKMGKKLIKTRRRIINLVKKSKMSTGVLSVLKEELRLYNFLEKKRAKRYLLDCKILANKFSLLNEETISSAIRCFKHNDEWQYWQSRFIEKILTQDKNCGLPFLVKACSDLRKIQEEFLNANLRLVISVVKRGNYPSQSFLDRFQDGCLGLLKAISYFDPKRNNKFSTYATNWIRQRLGRPDANYNGDICLPFLSQCFAKKIYKIKTQLESDGKASGFNAIEKAIDIFLEHQKQDEKSGKPTRQNQKVSKKTLRDAILAATAFVYLDEPMKNGAPMDVLVKDKVGLSPEEEMIKNDTERKIKDLLECVLDEKELFVIKRRFGFTDEEKLTLRELGTRFNLSRERIRQIEEKALTKLRHPARVNLFKELVTNR